MKNYAMRVVISFALFIGMVFASNSYGGSDDRFTTVGSAESTYTDGAKSFGYNDFFSENAFKNNMAEQGYSMVYDGLVSGVDLTAVQYSGLAGDPRKVDVDYVKTAEYNRLNSAKQAERMDAIDASVNNLRTTTGAAFDDVNARVAENSDRITAIENSLKKRLTLEVGVEVYNNDWIEVQTFVKTDIGTDEQRIEGGVRILLKPFESDMGRRQKLLEQRIANLEAMSVSTTD
jgi:hypothetical protein